MALWSGRSHLGCDRAPPMDSTVGLMEKLRAESVAHERSVELRPGVFRPDWTGVSTLPAREALRGRGELRQSLPKEWLEALSPREDLIWRTCTALFARFGRAPNFAELAAESGAPLRSMNSVLGALQRRDLLGLSSDGGALEYVYPFTMRDTGHYVHLHGQTLNALCAIDALGVGAMCKTDVTIKSSCLRCGTPIKLTTAQGGRCLDTISPTSLVVWYDFSSYCDSAASSCCPAIAFFCSDEHLWSSQSDRRGSRLTANEALEVGRAIFAPILAESKSRS
jgi:alkylmercury lyase